MNLGEEENVEKGKEDEGTVGRIARMSQAQERAHSVCGGGCEPNPPPGPLPGKANLPCSPH